MTNLIQLPTPGVTCPTWCTRPSHHTHFHAGDFHGHQERDINGETTFALGGRVMTLIDGHNPHVEILMWATEDGTVTTRENHPLTPTEARHLADVLLRLADDAEGHHGAAS